MNSIIYIYLLLVNDVCMYYWENIRWIKVVIFSVVISLEDIPTEYQGEQVRKNARPIIFTLITVWFVTRFCNALRFQCQIDVFTVFFLIWQLISSICKWQSHELLCFSFTLHQTTFCTFVAFVSYAYYDIIFRYLPVRYKFGILWFHAVKDW
jgi:hypothetical protein